MQIYRTQPSELCQCLTYIGIAAFTHGWLSPSLCKCMQQISVTWPCFMPHTRYLGLGDVQQLYSYSDAFKQWCGNALSSSGTPCSFYQLIELACWPVRKCLLSVDRKVPPICNVSCISDNGDRSGYKVGIFSTLTQRVGTSVVIFFVQKFVCNFKTLVEPRVGGE